MLSIVDEYVAKHRKSEEQFRLAKEIFPSGVTHDTRYMTPFPLYISHAKGARKWDIQGNELVCYVMGHGALLLGHSHPVMVSAVRRQIGLGTHLGSNSLQEVEWGAAVKRLMSSIEKIRFVSSGTEATLMALRLSRAFTKKSRIVKFRNHFHGWHDYVISEAGKYSSTGIPEAVTRSTIILDDDKIEGVERVLESDDDIAGVILEPTGAMMGCLPISGEFLHQLRDLCTRHGAVLIFDEVVTGFRVSRGGAQQHFGVKPDLTALGKILGGGLPGAAIGGRADILDLISFHEDSKWNASARVSHPGTFNANPLAAVSGTACLKLVATSTCCEDAERAATRLQEGLNRALASAHVPGLAYRSSSFVWILLGSEYQGRDSVSSLPRDTIKHSLQSPAMGLLKKAMLNEGVHMMGTAQFIVSAVHGNREIEDTVQAFEKVLQRMKKEDAFDTV